MSLEDLNQSVYKRDFKAPPIRDATPTPSASSTPHPTPSVDVWADRHKPSSAPVATSWKARLVRHKRLTFFLIGILVLVMIVAGFLGRRVFLFADDNVTVKITGPEIVQTGETAVLTIEYTNQNWIELSQAKLIVSFPESFQPVDGEGWEISLSQATRTIGDIPSRSSGRIIFSGTFQALEKKTALFKATLHSSPRGINNQTEKSSQWPVLVDDSALQIDVLAPPSVILSQSLEYVVNYKNESTEAIDNLRLLVDYPEGFVMTSSEPQPHRSEGLWLLNRLEPGATGRISIKGEIRGNGGDVRRLLVRIGKELGDGSFLSLAQEEKMTRVFSPPLAVLLTIGENSEKFADPGQELPVRISFENNSNVGIRDIIALVTLDESLLDMSALDVPRGVTYDRSKRQLIFKASEVPALRSLEPKEKGEINFGIKVRSDLASLGKRNVQIKTQVMLDSPDLPHGQNTEIFTPRSEAVVKVNSPTKIDLVARYDDPQFSNTGPMPPHVDEMTTYTVRFTATTDLNILNEAQLTLHLPSSTQFLGILEGDKNTLTYNNRTGELVWNLNMIEPGTSSARQLVFQIGFTPPPGSVGQSLNLINSGSFVAIDSFTNKKIEVQLSNRLSHTVIAPPSL